MYLALPDSYQGPGEAGKKLDGAEDGQAPRGKIFVQPGREGGVREVVAAMVSKSKVLKIPYKAVMMHKRVR